MGVDGTKPQLELAAFAVAETGLGNVDDKITKNHRKTLKACFVISTAKPAME